MTDNKLTIAEAARHFDVSERTIRRWIESGKLTSERTNGQRFVRLDTRTTECPNDRQMDNNVSRQLESENRHLREQLARHAQQIDHLTQVVAMSQKNIGALTEQLDDSRQMIEDMRSRSWWKRIFRR